MVLDIVVNVLYYGMILGAVSTLTVLFFVGGRRIRKYVAFYKANPESGPEPPVLDSWPRATIMVPATGNDVGMFEALASIAALDYPHFELFFITESEDDPAVQIIRQVIDTAEEHASVDRTIRHVVAGKALKCGQKNQNLLEGIRQSDPDSEVFVFFDSTHVLPSKMLRNLLAPLARGESEAVTGYHHVRPMTANIPAIGKAVTVLVMYMMQELPFATQPWGGNMAITREAFDRLGVGRMWEENLVDDVSLAMHLSELRKKTHSVVAACEVTIVESLSFRDWIAWLTRQWVYLRIYFPHLWLIAGTLAIILMLSTYVAPIFAVIGLCTGEYAMIVVPSVSFMLLLGGASALCRCYHPWPGPWWAWNLACIVGMFISVLAHVKTWKKDIICWRHYCYVVGKKGKVIEILPRN